MIKRRILPFLVLLISATCQAQFDTAFARKNIRLCADSLVQGFKTRNWEMYARFSYPALIGSMGGKEEFIQYVSQAFSGIPDSAWKKYETGQVLQVIKTAGDLQAIVELITVLEWQQIRISTTHHLVAESWNGGQFWTFFDSQNDPAAATLIKPDLSPQLQIPKKVEKMEPLPPPGKAPKRP